VSAKSVYDGAGRVASMFEPDVNNGNAKGPILRLKKEGPGLVRGMKARGRGVETEAGPEETLCCSASVE